MSSVLPLPRLRAATPATGAIAAGGGLQSAVMVIVFALLVPILSTLLAAAIGDKEEVQGVVIEICVFLAIGGSSALMAHFATRWRDAPIGHAWRIAAAIVLAALLSAFATEVVNVAAKALGYDPTAKLAAKGITGFAHRLILAFAVAAQWSLVLVVLYDLFESSRRAREELRAARIGALTVQQKMVEDELRAMQARVDPGLLFESLLAIDVAYAQAPGRGRQLLDALIRFLRAALPSEPSETSTVARERELIEAYIALAAESRPIAFHASVDPETADERLPSMLLLPLLRWATGFGSARSIDVRIGRASNALRIEIEHDAESGEPARADELVALRAQLAKLYLEQPRMDVGRERGRWRATLEIPRASLAAA